MTINIKLPEGWNSLNAKQLLIVARLLQQQTDRNKLLHKALFALSGIKVRWRPPVLQNEITYYPLKLKLKSFFLSENTIFDLKERLKWIIEPCTLTTQLFPTLMGRRGPENGLKNITWAEFEKAIQLFNIFNRTRKPADLDKLIAALYRKESISEFDPRYNGDTRMPFNPHHIASNARYFRRLSLDKKMAVYLFFAGSMANVVNKFPSVFDKSNTGTPDPLASFHMINAINNGDVTKNETLRNTPLFELLIFLESRKKQAENK